MYVHSCPNSARDIGKDCSTTRVILSHCIQCIGSTELENETERVFSLAAVSAQTLLYFQRRSLAQTASTEGSGYVGVIGGMKKGLEIWVRCGHQCARYGTPTVQVRCRPHKRNRNFSGSVDPMLSQPKDEILPEWTNSPERPWKLVSTRPHSSKPPSRPTRRWAGPSPRHSRRPAR